MNEKWLGKIFFYIYRVYWYTQLSIQSRSFILNICIISTQKTDWPNNMKEKLSHLGTHKNWEKKVKWKILNRRYPRYKDEIRKKEENIPDFPVFSSFFYFSSWIKRYEWMKGSTTIFIYTSILHRSRREKMRLSKSMMRVRNGKYTGRSLSSRYNQCVLGYINHWKEKWNILSKL